MRARALAPMEVAGRLPRLRELLAEGGADGFLVTSLVNIRYLTGFTGSASLLYVSQDDGVLLVTDGRYEAQAGAELEAAGVEAEVRIGPPAVQLAALTEAAGSAATVGFEAEHLTWAQHARLAADDAFGPGKLVAQKSTVERLRLVKDSGELARMEVAAGIADAALASVLSRLGGWTARKAGVSEAEVAAELDHAMRRGGSSEPAFETIVACGANAAMPHHRASPSRIDPHRPIVIDFGATVDGYRSDMTRTVSVGEIAGDKARRMWDVVAQSQAAGVAAVRPGVTVAEVDRACRELIADAGWGDAFVHGTGHGVGLDIHEAPWVSASSDELLRVGSVVTVEPGVYLPGVGGVRIEDTVVVTTGGCRALTRSPKEPAIF